MTQIYNLLPFWVWLIFAAIAFVVTILMSTNNYIKKQNVKKSDSRQTQGIDFGNSNHFTFNNSPVTQIIGKLEFAKKTELLGPRIKGKRINITDLTESDGIQIRNKILENCEIYGPAIVYLTSSTVLKYCAFTIPPDWEYFWELEDGNSNRTIIGVIGIRDCEFENCTFSMIGFVGYKNLHDKFRKMQRRLP